MGIADLDFAVRKGTAQSDVEVGEGERLDLELEMRGWASWTLPLAGSKQALKGLVIL